MLAVRSPIAIGLLCLSVQIVSVFLVYVYHQSCSQSQKLQFQPCSCKGKYHTLHRGDFQEGMLRCLLLCLHEHTQGQSKGVWETRTVWFFCTTNPIDQQYKVLGISNNQNLSKEKGIYMKHLVPNLLQVRIWIQPGLPLQS